MNHTSQSSGNLVADRRADYASAYADSNDYIAAADLIIQALELTPQWDAGWFRLGNYHEKLGDIPNAIAAYRNTLKFSHADYLGAGLKIAYLEGGVMSDSPLAYTEALFDDYANRFDSALLERLEYQVPKLLAAMLHTYSPQPFFQSALDLGCGTGLMGTELSAEIHSLIGVDLSGAMLAKAKAKNIYDNLIKADITNALSTADSFDLIMAADVFMYVPNLETIFRLVSSALLPAGIFLFSVEKADGNTPWQLLESMRHAHRADYVEAMLDRFGFKIINHAEAIIRMGGGKPIVGLLYLAQKAA